MIKNNAEIKFDKHMFFPKRTHMETIGEGVGGKPYDLHMKEF